MVRETRMAAAIYTSVAYKYIVKHTLRLFTDGELFNYWCNSVCLHQLNASFIGQY